MSGLSLTADEVKTIQTITQAHLGFQPSEKFVRKAISESTIRGARYYGWLRSGVPDIWESELVRELTDEPMPKKWKSYEAWKVWRKQLGESYAEWERKH